MRRTRAVDADGAIEIARPGGAVGRVGVPQNETMPASRPAFYDNVTVGRTRRGPRLRRRAPAGRPEGRIEPGRVFERVVRLDEVPEGYRAMADRTSITVMVTP